MHTLHHVVLSPACRSIRLQLGEKKLELALELERPWERRPSFLALSPSGEVPVLRANTGAIVVGGYAIREYLEETHSELPLMPSAPAARAEVRRLTDWSERLFETAVSGPLLSEKVFKRFGWSAYGSTSPDMARIRQALEDIHPHLDYLGGLADRRGWLAEELSLADLTAAAHLSAIDFLGDVPWDEHPAAREWYARIKSRPAFRALLNDQVAGIQPPAHYANLDF